MANAPTENLIRIDAVDIAPGERRTVLKPLNGEAIASAINKLKAKIDPSQHGEVDAAFNLAMSRFADRRYTQAFAETVKPLDDALKSAVAGETSRLASMLGLSHITREGVAAQRQNFDQMGAVNRTVAQTEAEARAALAKKAQEDALAQRRAQEQAAADASLRARGAAILDTLGGKRGTPNPPATITAKQ